VSICDGGADNKHGGKDDKLVTSCELVCCYFLAIQHTVGVSAVRDLYGTVMNEGANKGILVTTSDYGPDAYAFANGKPLVLLNGAHLLHLLEKHGYQARIDLQEARKIALSQPS
jgi:restriction endonuclease Mrr